MNENIAIQVSSLSKKYSIGKDLSHTSFSELIHNFFKSKEKKKIDFWALKEINLSILKGEVVGIIGNNGAGKSTLLKILSQITKPTEGSIHINGRIASLLEVGTGFHPELSGRENIYLNGTILGMSKKEVKSKFDEIVNFSGIGKFIDTPVKNYSSGMYVRLAFAVAAHLEPEILIIDEVLAVGDAEFQKKCLGKMREVSGNGRTVIFVSHDLGMIQNLCSRCYLLENGSITEHGVTMNVIDTYKKSMSKQTEFKKGNAEHVYFHKIAILNEAGIEKNIFDFNEHICIKGTLLSDGSFQRSLQICIALLDKNGRRVFSEIKNFNGETIGEIQFYLRLPKNLIAPNLYAFLFQVYVPPGNIIIDQHENILPIEIIDNGSKLLGYKDFGSLILNETIELRFNKKVC